MSKNSINKKQILEAALMSVGKPLTVEEMRKLFKRDERPTKKDILDILEQIADQCNDFGYELKELSSGYRFQAKPELAPWLAKLWPERPPRLSKAFLETISIIAYKQPVTRAEIEDIRGVSVSSNIIRTLLDRKWIKALGQKDIPGRPTVYGTTNSFLDYFSLKSLNELPALEDIPDLDIEDMLMGDSPLMDDGNIIESEEEEEESLAMAE